MGRLISDSNRLVRVHPSTQDQNKHAHRPSSTHFCPAFLREEYTARTRSGGDCTDVGDRLAPSAPSPSWRASLLLALGSGLENGNIGRLVPEEARSSEVTVFTTLETKVHCWVGPREGGGKRWV